MTHAAVFALAVVGLLAAAPSVAQTSAEPPPGQIKPPASAATTPSPPGPRGEALPHPRRSRAASIHVDRVGLRVDVYCTEGESTRSCVEAAMPLVDKMNALVPVK